MQGDEVDRANAHAEWEREMALKRVREQSKATAIQATGHCLYCDESVEGERRFCDAYCSKEYERGQAAARRNGGAYG